MKNYGLQSPAGRDIVIIILVFAVLSIVSVVLRFISRRMKGLKLATEDYLALIAAVIVNVCGVLVITTVTHGGVGLHVGEVDMEDVRYTMKIIIPMQCCYAAALGLLKTSLLLLFRKLFGTARFFPYIFWPSLVVVWGWSFSIILESFLLCSPVEFNWNPMLPGGTCGNRNAAFVAAGALNMATDLMVIAIPIPYILGLQLGLGRKIGLISIFSVGLLISAISIVRMKSLLEIDFMDVTYTLPMPLMWSMVEQYLAVVCANMPLLRVVVARMLPSGWMSDRSKGKKTTGSSSLGRRNAANHFNKLEEEGSRSTYACHLKDMDGSDAAHLSRAKDSMDMDIGYDGSKGSGSRHSHDGDKIHVLQGFSVEWQGR